MLDPTDFALIRALIEKPLATDNEIKQILKKKSPTLDVSISTINRRVKSLITDNIVQGAVPEINFPLLGLELHTFVLDLDQNAWEYNAQSLKKFFDAHPYTNFQCRIYGANNGIFCQFVLPSQGSVLEKLLDIFQIFIESKIIISYHHYPSVGPSASTPTELKGWNNKYEEWSIDFDLISNALSTNTTKYIPKYREVQPILHEIQPLDLIILREMTRNARRSQSEILDFIKNKDPEGIYIDYFKDHSNPTSKQTFSRRYQFLLESGVITHFELAYDRLKFGMFNQALYIGKNDPVKLAALRDCINKEFIPYPCRLSFSDKHFIFWVNLPPVEIIHFPDRLLNHFNGLEIYLFGRFPAKYFFYHKNYDHHSGSWNTSSTWVVDEPLEILGLSKN